MGGKIILPGGTGFLGKLLIPKLLEKKYEPIVFSRSQKAKEKGVSYVHWDGRGLGNWTHCLKEATAIINFSGRSVNTRLTRKTMDEILNSRVGIIKLLCKALDHYHYTMPVFIQCSAVGYYGNTGEVCKEDAPPGQGFLAEVCKKLENALVQLNGNCERKVILRLGIVLGEKGGALPLLTKLTSFFLGGAAGHGNQCISWIHQQDLIRLFLLCIEDKKKKGIYNAVSPSPVSNSEFMKVLRSVLKRPWTPPIPAKLLKISGNILGFNPELILDGQCCVPERLNREGFEFVFKELEPAFKNILKKS